MIDQLLNELENIKEDIEELKASEATIKAKIAEHYAADLEQLYKAKDEPFGAVNIVDGDVTLTFTTPKKVEWDQVALGNLYKEIGDTASEYMDTVYKVKEAAFKNWPSSIQDAFIPARTVSTGAMTMKWKRKDA